MRSPPVHLAGMVDAHQHFWDPATADYPWMTDAVAQLRRAFGPADLVPELDRAGIRHSVVVQARSELAETRELCGLAASHDFVRGVVGWAPLAAAELGELLDEVLAGPGGDRLVGIRHQVEDEADAGWLLRPEVRRGLAVAADRGLAYDLLIRPDQLTAAAAVVAEHDQLRFVVDHLGKPDLDPAKLTPWSDRMRVLASFANVSCKVSGFATCPLPPGADLATAVLPFIGAAVDMFGTERLMFGSDWPVCTLQAPYQEVVDVVASCAATFTDTERAGLFGGNASRIYRLAGAASDPVA